MRVAAAFPAHQGAAARRLSTAGTGAPSGAGGGGAPKPGGLTPAELAARLRGGSARPAVVTEYSRRRVAATRLKWQAFRLLTWGMTAGMAVYCVFVEDYSGVEGTGDHVFIALRRGIKRTVDSWIAGDDDALQQQEPLRVAATAPAVSREPPHAAEAGPSSHSSD